MKVTRWLIISNTLWSAVAQLGVMAINLFVLPLFIKNLGAELYGIWVISNVILGYLNVCDFGFTQGLQKYAAEALAKKDDKELSQVIVSGTGLLLLIGLMLGIVCFLGASSIVSFFSIQPENQLVATKLLQISALFCVIMWPLRIVDVVLNASMHIKELNFLNAFKLGAQSVVMLAMVWMAADVVLMKWVTAALVALCSAAGLLMVRRYVPFVSWSPSHFNFHQLKRMHKFSLGMFYISLLTLLISRVDTLIIGKVMSMYAVAAYSVAVKLYELIYRVISMFMVAVVPAAYNISAAADKKKLQLLVHNGVFYRAMLSVPLCFIAILIAPYFIRLWMGEEYSSVVIWAQIRCISPLFTSLGVANSVARGAGYVKSSNIIFTINILVNFGLSLWLVHYYGIGGPILGTVISMILVGDFTMFPWFCRIMDIEWKKTFWIALKVVMVGALVFWLGWALRLYIAIDGVIDLALFSGGMAICYGLVFSLLFLRTEFSQIYQSVRSKVGGL